jgi:hypothetical protein
LEWAIHGWLERKQKYGLSFKLTAGNYFFQAGPRCWHHASISKKSVPQRLVAKLFPMGKMPDPDIPILKEAKAEYAKLQ